MSERVSQLKIAIHKNKITSTIKRNVCVIRVKGKYAFVILVENY